MTNYIITGSFWSKSGTLKCHYCVPIYTYRGYTPSVNGVYPSFTYHKSNNKLDEEPHIAHQLHVEESLVRLAIRLLPAIAHIARVLRRNAIRSTGPRRTGRRRVVQTGRQVAVRTLDSWDFHAKSRMGFQAERYHRNHDEHDRRARHYLYTRTWG